MSYIGNQPVLQTTQFREEFPVTASTQPSFTTGGFHPSAVSVYRNGVLLSEDDYTKGSDNVTITLNNAAVSGDIVVIEGNRSLAQGVSVSESRVEYTWQSGDTVVQLNADVIPAYTDVYLNGVKLAAADYTINTVNRTVSFTPDPAVGDVIAVVHRNETSALVALPLKDSQGNEILSESGNAVSIGTLRLPTSGGIQDSSGANVLTEASGTVTLTADEMNVGSNALVVDSSGNVGIGTSSPNERITISSSVIASYIQLCDSSTGNTSSDGLFIGSFNGAAEIKTKENNVLAFGTNNTERMRIDSSGRMLVGGIASEPSGGFGSYCFAAQNSGNNAAFKTTASANAGASILSIRDTDGIQISFHQGGSYISAITTNGSTVSYGTGSDYRLKENITDITDGISRVKQLKPSRFNFIVNPDKTVDGFIAHEVSSIVPEAIVGEKDAVYEDGSINPQSIDQSKLVPLLTAALQESIGLIESQQSQIDALTARIEALESTP